MRNLFFTCACLFTFNTQAQLNTDSLKRLVASAKEDSTKVLLLSLLSFNSWDRDSCLRWDNEALALASGERALEVFLENILEEEQDGVDNLTRILRDPKAVAASAKYSGASAGYTNPRTAARHPLRLGVTNASGRR